MILSIETKVKWTYTPGKKIRVSKEYWWVRGQKVKVGINFYPQIPIQFIIHMDLQQETCVQQILKTSETITAAEYLQVAVQGNEKWFPCLKQKQKQNKQKKKLQGCKQS